MLLTGPRYFDIIITWYFYYYMFRINIIRKFVLISDNYFNNLRSECL